jgi:hypothetical protein
MNFMNSISQIAGVVARVEGLRGKISEAEKPVNGLFESLSSQSFEVAA